MSAAQVLNEVVEGVPPVPTQATLHATLRPREAVRMIERDEKLCSTFLSRDSPSPSPS